jgi:hypothetical protein
LGIEVDVAAGAMIEGEFQSAWVIESSGGSDISDSMTWAMAQLWSGPYTDASL